MALTPFTDVVQDTNGNAQPYAQVTVVNQEDDLPALIYYDVDGALPVPGGVITCDQYGRFLFFSSGGMFKLTAGGITTEYVSIGAGQPGVVLKWTLTAGQTLIVPASAYGAPMAIQVVPGASSTIQVYSTLDADTGDSLQWESWPPGAASTRTTYTLQATVAGLIFVASGPNGGTVRGVFP